MVAPHPNVKSRTPAKAGASIFPKSPEKFTVPTAADLPESLYALETMLEPNGCWVPPPKPPMIAKINNNQNPFDIPIPTRPADAQRFPETNIQNSPNFSAIKPAGTCSMAVAPLCADFINPTSAYVRPKLSFIAGSSGIGNVNIKSLQICISEPKIRMRLGVIFGLGI